jgi:integrase/recombinase XerD
MGLSGRSLKELGIHLRSLLAYCKISRVRRCTGITPEFLSAFLQINAHRGKAHLKMVVWTLRTFGAYLAVMQYLPDSPAKDLSHPVLRTRNKLPQYLRVQELSDFLESACNERSLADLAVIMFMCNAGLRPSEICKLRPKDINVATKTIAVTVKGNWLRLMPVATILAETLDEYLQQYDGAPSSHLFINQWGRPIDVRWIQRLVREVARQAGIRRTVTPCILRHTFATYLADRHGKAVTRVLLGHAVGASTDTYMHLAPRQHRDYMNRHPFQTTPDEGAALDD